MTALMLPVPTSDERSTAKQLAAVLKQHAGKIQLVFDDGSNAELPPIFSRLLMIAAEAMMRGKGIRAIPISDKITTQMAAQIMGCSRQHVVNLLENGDLRFSKIGTHRRIAFQDLLAFMENEDKLRDEAMADIIDATNDMGGYDSA